MRGQRGGGTRTEGRGQRLRQEGGNRTRRGMGARRLLAAAAGLLLAWQLVVRGHVPRVLYQHAGRGGGMFGFQPDETNVGAGERVRAMDTLARAAGGRARLMTAKDAADEQLRWLRPFYTRQATTAAAGDVLSESPGVGHGGAAGLQSRYRRAGMGGYGNVQLTQNRGASLESQARELAGAEATRRAQGGEAIDRALSPVGESPAGRSQQLAEIYGVQISDDDARKFFGTDYEKEYHPPTSEELHEYIQDLAQRAPPSAADATDDAPPAEEDKAEEDCAEDDEECEAEKKAKWPEQPIFGPEHKSHSATLWCTWPGGQEQVPCQIGKGGAFYDERFSAGVWGRHRPNRETLVNNGVWRFPGARPPHSRFPRRIVRP